MDILACSGTRMQIYSSSTGEAKKTFSRFKDVVYCGSFRPDGKLIAAGDASGKVQVVFC